jgi:hypothetical protein
MAQESLVRYFVPWSYWRVWNALHTNLPGTSAADDLALIGGTFATASPTIQSSDLKAAGLTELYARCVFPIPIEYVAGQTATIRAHAGMKTTVADTKCDLDFVVYESDEEEGIGSDLNSTAATDMNSVTLADLDFALAVGTLSPGDQLDIRMHVSLNDAATGTAVIAMVGSVELMLDIKG